MLSNNTLADSTNTAMLDDQQQKKTHQYTKHKSIVWESRSKLALDIYVPQTGRDDYPVLLVIHGGGWLVGDKKT